MMSLNEDGCMELTKKIKAVTKSLKTKEIVNQFHTWHKLIINFFVPSMNFCVRSSVFSNYLFLTIQYACFTPFFIHKK